MLPKVAPETVCRGWPCSSMRSGRQDDREPQSLIKQPMAGHLLCRVGIATSSCPIGHWEPGEGGPCQRGPGLSRGWLFWLGRQRCAAAWTDTPVHHAATLASHPWPISRGADAAWVPVRLPITFCTGSLAFSVASSTNKDQKFGFRHDAVQTVHNRFRPTIR